MAVKKKKRHIRPGIKRFIDGFLYGAGIALGLTAVAAVGLLFLMAVWRYGMYH